MSESALNLQIPFLSRQISHPGKYTHHTIYMIYLLYTLQQCGADSTDEMGHSPGGYCLNYHPGTLSILSSNCNSFEDRIP